MAGKQIATDTVILQSDIDAYETALQAVKDKTENMFNNMKALDQMWDGMANSAFMTQFTNDYTTMTEMCNLLGSLLENLRTAKKEYEQCESSINTTIKDIQIESL